MRAFAFSLFLLLYWTLVGRAFLCLCRDRVGVLRSWLVSPSLGLTVTVVGLMVGNQAGVPIGHFAWPLTWILGLGAILTLFWRRPALPGWAFLPFVASALLALVWAGWPLFKYGFHWTSFVNDDYLNYCMSAERFRDFGFYRVPTTAELMGKDYTQYFWFMHVSQMMRFGSEHIVAWCSALTGLRTMMAFMPAIVPLAGLQVMAVGGLVLHRGRWRRAAQAASFALALSPLFTFGTIYQLISQVGGLALAMTFLALGTRRLGARRGWNLLPMALSAGLAGAGMALFYPESSPFAWLAIAFCLVIETVRQRGISRPRVQYWLLVCLLAVVILRTNLLSYGYTLYEQAAYGLSHSGKAAVMFPYFLIPSGMPMLFGLEGLSDFPAEPWGSVLIVAGAIVLLAVVVTSIRLAWRGEPVGCLLLIQVLLGVSLFRQENDFGLYKLSMYIQPTALAALAWWLTRRRGVIRIALAIVFVGLNGWVSWRYVNGAAGAGGPVLNELEGASDRMSHMPPLNPSDGVWAAGLDNVAAVKFATERYRGTELKFLDKRYLGPGIFHIDYHSPLMALNPHRELYRAAHRLADETDALSNARTELFGTSFVDLKLPDTLAGYLVNPGPTGLFNKLPALPPDHGRLLEAVPAARARNLAMFVDSSEGSLYYLANTHDLEHISLYQREHDVFLPAGGVYALGRFLLLRVEHASDTVYLRMLASKSSKGQGRTHWTGAGVVIGRETVPLTFVGDGSGNVFAGPVHPVRLGNASYIAVDFREAPSHVNIPRYGLNLLFHRSVPLDYREIIAFGRDISVLSPEDCAGLAAPQALTSATQLLTDGGLRYSGLYEDGWISGNAYVELAPAQSAQALRVQGYAPDVGGTVQHLHLKVNGRPLPDVDYAPGTIDWLIPVPPGSERTRFDITSDDPVILPNGDGRPVTMWLTSIGLAPMPSRYDFVDGKGPRPFEPGVDTDGWAADRAELILPSVSAGHLKLKLLFPNWGQRPAQGDVTIAVDGGLAETRVLPAGTTVIDLPVQLGGGGHRVRLTSATQIRLPAPDHRVRAYQLQSAEFEP